MADIHTYTEEKQFSRSNNNCEAGIGLPQSNQYNRVLARIITKGWGGGGAPAHSQCSHTVQYCDRNNTVIGNGQVLHFTQYTLVGGGLTVCI